MTILSTILMEKTAFKEAYSVLIKELESKNFITFIKNKNNHFHISRHMSILGVLSFTITEETRFFKDELATHENKSTRLIGEFTSARACLVELAKHFNQEL